MRRVPPVPAPRSAAELPVGLIDQEIARRQQQGTATAQVQATAPRMSMRSYVPFAWPIVEGRRLFLPNWHLDAVSDHLEAVFGGQIGKLVINMPPGMAKSLMVSVFGPSWQWGPGGRPDSRFLCLSYGGSDASPANRDAERCRDLICSARYQREWGTQFRMSDTQNAKSFYRNDKGGYRVSSGLDGQPSGQRADYVFIDDPTKLDEDSLASILHPSEVYERNLYSRANDDGSAFVLMMQRLHPDDLSGYFLKQDGWTHLMLPMFYEAERKCRVFLGGALFFEDPRTSEGAPLHPRMNTAVDKAEAQRRNRPDIYEGQQQQRPTSKMGQVVTRVERFDELPNHLDEIIVTVDCAFKAGEDNSFVVFQKWGRRFANAYLLDQQRDHMELPATVEALALFCQRAPLAGAKYVEAKANGVGVVQTLRNHVPGLMTTDDDEDTLKPFCAGSKEAKLQSVSPYFQAGNVHIPSASWLATRGMTDWTPEYVQELTTFPKSRFNDQVDATSMAVWKLLHTFEAHVPAGFILQVDAGNVGPGAGTFETAYAQTESIGNDLARGAFGSRGGGGGLSDLMRGAYGR